MMTENEHIQKALDTLAELCAPAPEEDTTDRQYHRRGAAEEILRHYRETRAFREGIRLIVSIDGHVPVRPVEKVQN
jgi:hypothetical protein